MAEIQLNNIILFDRGYIVESSTNLSSGMNYSLSITDGINTITKTYTPTKLGNMIADSWGSIVPFNVNVCMTLIDSTGCPPILCTLTVI